MLPNHTPGQIRNRLQASPPSGEPTKILVLYGSLRPSSYSRLLANQVVEILHHFGANVRLFDPADLPLYDGANQEHPKVQQLREWSAWSQGQVWISPEIHGNISAVFKNQIDWIPLDQSASRATQGKTLAVMQISGGSQSFNTVNSLRVLGRWMRMFTIPNQSSIAKAWQEFDKQGRLRDSSFRDRVIDVLEELVKTTMLLRGQDGYLTERYSENKLEEQASNMTQIQNLVAASGVAEPCCDC
ncbi:arsenical resistance protein ArsH [Microbulbifer sp. A4B17]|uniref:arsenical resistance protein ArsH n=1 Tax=Microbulbifer sp. A4B17 TaxID=359370 RepID=UPI000D52E66F|nr:arsenical resistance protein ArsH [Microbulbifer sp. A4B17]